MGTDAARRTNITRPATVWLGVGIGGGLLLALSLAIGLPAATAAPPAAVAPAAPSASGSPPQRPAATRVRQSPEGIEWQSLSPAQRQWLAPLERDWPFLEAGQKLKWLEIAQRLPGMPASERQRIQDRMASWARMTPTERGQARLRYLQARRTSPDDRGARWEDYQALPTDQKKQLAARAAPAASAATSTRKPVVAKTSEKSNLVTNPNFGLPPKAVAPTVIQARPGATTTLVSKQPSPPPHQQTGLPKIAATPGFIDKETLLPRRGPQGAATLSLDTSEPDPAPAPRP